MPVATDASYVKLTVSGGVVWSLHGRTLPRTTGMSVGEFLSRRPLPRMARVVGLQENVELILGLFKGRRRGDVASLEVCSPLCCATASDRRDPELVLYHMRSYQLAASLGGWHEFCSSSLPSYALASLAADGRLARDDQEGTVSWLLSAHPAWPALSFISGVDRTAVCRLLGLVLDPRYYVDPDEPNRGSKLEQYLGINPRTQTAVSDGLPGGWLADRCRLVRSCWRGCVSDPAYRPSRDDPRGFLWRAWDDRGGGARGDLTAAKLFVSFLRHSWLNEIAGPSHRGRLFVPRYFFPPDVASAYAAHVAAFPSVRPDLT